MERPYLIEEWGPKSPWYLWARGYGERNLWRVQHAIGNDIEDFMSEAALTYVEVRIRYGASVKNAAHFMYLYKRGLSNWVHDLSHKDNKIKIGLSKVSPNEPTAQHTGDLEIALSRSSSELKEVLNIILNAPKEIMDVVQADIGNPTAKQFWYSVVNYLGIKQEKSKELMQELNTLLG